MSGAERDDSPARLRAVAEGAERVTVALVGRPNSGKTSLLIHLTGAGERPVNFPGTSVERAVGHARMCDRQVEVVDLPGIVSMEPQSRDEAVALDFLQTTASSPAPRVMCVVIDAQKLAVELRLLHQLRGLSVPIVVALTKCDLASDAGRPVDCDALQRALGLPLCCVNALEGTGIKDLGRQLVEVAVRHAGEPLPQADAGADVGAGTQLAVGMQDDRARRRTATDRIDSVLLHKVLGPVFLVLVLLAMFQLVFHAATPFMDWIEAAQGWASARVEAFVPAGALQSFLVDGLVNGLGSAFIFVPQIALLIALVTAMESSGYMARAVFLLDLLLRRVGLTGKSFVPLTSSFACAIPGIMASRIIADERDRLATIVVSPLMSCSARLPVYVILLAAFFPPAQAGLLLFLMYALGIVVAALVAFLLRRTLLKGGRSTLTMELPAYQRPGLRMVGRQVLSSVRAFLVTAGSIILAATVVVWLLAYYPRSEQVSERFELQRAEATAAGAAEVEFERIDREEQAAHLEQSMLATIGKAIQPAFAPAGFDWRVTVSVLAAFPARELVVPTLGTLHSLGDVEADADDPDAGLQAALRHATDADGNRTMNGLVALALMAFFALCSQCAATLAAIARETHSWRWPLFTFGYMTMFAWLVAVLIYQVGSGMGYGIPR